MHLWILLVHALGATIWTGGHLVLALTVLPRALRTGSPEMVLQFEEGYEKLGMPALVVQIITGIWLAYRYLPDPGAWFGFGSPLAVNIFVKLALLALTLALAVHARLRVIPRLDAQRLKGLAYHIVAVTVLAVLFVVMGIGFRFGGVL
jgi:putative copper export protein